MMAGAEGKLKLLQALVVDQWKTGGAAELRVSCESGHLRVSVSAEFGPSCPSWRSNSASVGGSASGSPCRQRRRERRAAARAALEKARDEKATAAEKVNVKVATWKMDAEEVSAVKVSAEEASSEEVSADEVSAKSAAEKCADQNAAAEKCATLKADTKKCAAKKTAEKCATKEAAAEKYDAKKAAVECAAAKAATASTEETEKAVAGCALTPLSAADEASTSCLGGQPTACETCWSCEGFLSPDHKCEVKSEVMQLAPLPPALPLCHYCCHEGSGDQPVHFFQRCLCDEIACVCQCYCTESQVIVKRKHFTHRHWEVNPLSPEKRAEAHAFASAQNFKFYGSYNGCTSTTCSE